MTNPVGVTPRYLDCRRLICTLIKTSPEGLPLPAEWHLCSKCQGQERGEIVPFDISTVPVYVEFTIQYAVHGGIPQ